MIDPYQHPCRLTPEEDAIGDPNDTDDEIDDLLPADLWFRVRFRRQPDTGLVINAAA